MEFPEKHTKRMYLSLVSGNPYDVCGLDTPVTIMLKHELGRDFDLNTKWDTPIPKDCPDDSTTSRKRCMTILKLLYGLAKVRFPRCLRPLYVPESTPAVLSIFTDSSEKADAAVAYINWPVSESKRESRVALAKASPFPKSLPFLTPTEENC